MQHYDGKELEYIAKQVEHAQKLFETMITNGYRDGVQMRQYTGALMSIAHAANSLALDSFHEGMADHWRAE